MNQDLSMYRPAAFSIIYGLENTVRVFFFQRVYSLLTGILFDHDEIQERFLPVAAGMTEFEKL